MRRVSVLSRSYFTVPGMGKFARPRVAVILACGHAKTYEGAREPKAGARVVCRLCPPLKI